MPASNQTEPYCGFSIFWQEPPLTAAKWTANVGSDDRRLHILIEGHGIKIIDAPTRAGMLSAARSYIDTLLT